MKIVFASHNAGKLKELQSLLSPFDLQVMPQAEFNIKAPEETGKTFIENALLKARFASQQTGLWALSDDSGLIVDVLKGAPGIYSARYAGPSATAEENIQKLLKELQSFPDEKHKAAFYCVIVLLRYETDPTPLIGEGFWQGLILKHPRGSQGFGYDPIFFDPKENLAAAEMSLARKNQISHRALALKILLEKLNAGAFNQKP